MVNSLKPGAQDSALLGQVAPHMISGLHAVWQICLHPLVAWQVDTVSLFNVLNADRIGEP